ncbi:MAG: undecaprenyl-diphosphate phosphatase [Elusimicrobia bacterium]|nr:undecaprenyl-diphosphate phosphatase [Elusimicrobiota bacterium]
MGYFQSIVLGIVQGLTEFLPISSSAHLVIVPRLLNWSYQGLAYDVALHWGTLIAVVVYFWKDWLNLITNAIKDHRSRISPGSSLRGAAATKQSHEKGEPKLFWYIAMATIPAGLAGIFLEDQAETLFREPRMMALTLIGLGFLLGLSDRVGAKSKNEDSLGLWPCLAIGCAQALAIIPGVSRSGITITAALFLGFRREAAARFSFLLSTPIVLAAGLLKFKDLSLADMNGPFLIGVLAAALSGFWAIQFLIGYLKTKSAGIFVFYRVCLGLLILFWH